MLTYGIPLHYYVDSLRVFHFVQVKDSVWRMAGGGLGQLIPPSTMMTMYVMIAQQSVGKLFMRGVVPGLILSAIYCT